MKSWPGFLDGDEAFDVVRVLRVEQLEPFLEFRDLVPARRQLTVAVIDFLALLARV